MASQSVQRLQVGLVVNRPAEAVEAAIRRYVSSLCGCNGAAAVQVETSAMPECGKHVCVYIDATHASQHDPKARDILALSWVPDRESACPMFSGTLMLFEHDARACRLALDGAYEYLATAQHDRMDWDSARLRAAKIGKEILRLLSVLDQQPTDTPAPEAPARDRRRATSLVSRSL